MLRVSEIFFGSSETARQVALLADRPDCDFKTGNIGRLFGFLERLTDSSCAFCASFSKRVLFLTPASSSPFRLRRVRTILNFSMRRNPVNQCQGFSLGPTNFPGLGSQLFLGSIEFSFALGQVCLFAADFDPSFMELAHIFGPLNECFIES